MFSEANAVRTEEKPHTRGEKVMGKWLTTLLLASLFALSLPFVSANSSASANTTAPASEVAKSADEVHPLLVGLKVPDVKLVSAAGASASLREIVSKKKTVLVFYRGGWCPFCSLQLKDLKESMGELTKLGYQLIAVSSDQPKELIVTTQKQALEYSLFSDSSAEASKAFGIAFRVSDEENKKYRGYGIDLDKASGNSQHVLPVPAVFILSTDGEIQFEYINPNYKVRLRKEILLAAAKVFAQTQAK
jgi:peroxiredoxin